jgi:hypothetical protein
VETVTPPKEIAMTKNAPEAPDATLSLLTVAEASNEASQTYPQQGTIFDDLSLIGTLLFGGEICEPPADESEMDSRH